MNKNYKKDRATELDSLPPIDYNKLKLNESQITHLTYSDRKRSGSLGSDSTLISSTINDSTLNTQIIVVPTGLKIISLLSMVTALTLIIVSGILLFKTNQTLLAWLKAAPTTLNILSEVSKVFGGTGAIVQEVESQEKYLRILIICSATLIIAGTVQLICNLWFFCRMNTACITRCLVRSDEFCCGR